MKLWTTSETKYPGTIGSPSKKIIIKNHKGIVDDP